MIASLDYYDVESVNKAILNLYNDDLTLNSRILSFLHNLMGLVYFDRATILFYYKDSKTGQYNKLSSISVNWENDQDVVQTYNDHYCHIDDTLPVFDRETPIIFRSSTFFDARTRNKNKYWSEYLVPNNCIWSLEGNLHLRNNRGIKGCFSLYRSEEKSDFSDKDVAICTLLQPHLSNTLKDYGENTDSTSLMFMLDNYNCVGVAILDDHCQIIRSNVTYKNLIESENINTVINSKAISMCMELASRNNPEGRTSVEYKLDDYPIFMEVSRTASDSSNAQYTCMVYDLSHFISKTLDRAKEKYTLTGREFDILQAVLKGKSNDEIASELYLSLPTVKKYLASIYSKMDIKNQKQIFDRLKFQ